MDVLASPLMFPDPDPALNGSGSGKMCTYVLPPFPVVPYAKIAVTLLWFPGTNAARFGEIKSAPDRIWTRSKWGYNPRPIP